MVGERPIVGVGAIIIDNGGIVMVRRGRGPAEGLWSLPGGRVEQGELVEDALRREVKEETGLDVEITGFAGVFEILGDAHYIVLDYIARRKGGELEAGTDAAEVRLVPLDEIEDLECTPRLIQTLRRWSVVPANDRNKRT